ncbi:hypothetical protein INT44_004100 [Umbelopsis vinacea]|uniref:Uncharacterized protein n=1 Tax=Umbelopsis vinacea TaxID=44442 RepID=A0A8H7QAL8_9FUNG|nr:hypothetical protein INT44_004100 [Umbelopsis vinacea]
MDEFVVNLCMNCDRKWRKFRDGYLHEHEHSEPPQHSATEMRSTEPPPPPHIRQLHPEPTSLHFESDEHNRPLITRSMESSPEVTYQRKRRRRDTVMSEHHQLTSSNFGKFSHTALNPTSHRFFEQELHFRRTIFTPDHALQLGLAIIDLAKSQPQNPLVVDITLNGFQVFRFAMQGTGPDDDEWIRRKRNVVDRFRHSSALVQSQIDYLGSNAVERYPIHDPRYGFYPGSFPIIVSGVGVVGSITVAGSNLRADHDVIIAALQKLSTEQPLQNDKAGPEGFRQPIT